jgi:DNA adenine methylase
MDPSGRWVAEHSRAIPPFVRWPGGKRWLPAHLVALCHGLGFERYLEPFFGGGAVFFALRPPKSVLSDVNEDLMTMYRQVRWRPRRILQELRRIRVDHDTYMRVRTRAPSDSLGRAVRFLYLNRTSFGGLYRTNRKGEFNVPFGSADRMNALVQSDLLMRASRALHGATLMSGDFEAVLDRADDGDMAYCDPIYSVAHNDNGFVRYNEPTFSWSDQRRLFSAALRASRRGVVVVVTNADHESVRSLYATAVMLRLSRTSRLCPSPQFRRLTSESLYILAPPAISRAIARNADRSQSVVSYGVERLSASQAVPAMAHVGYGLKRQSRG